MKSLSKKQYKRLHKKASLVPELKAEIGRLRTERNRLWQKYEPGPHILYMDYESMPPLWEWSKKRTMPEISGDTLEFKRTLPWGHGLYMGESRSWLDKLSEVQRQQFIANEYWQDMMRPYAKRQQPT